MGVATPLIAVAMILTEGLFGAGNTRFVAAAQFLLIFVWLVPASYLFGMVLHGGLGGVWIAAFVYSCLAAVTMTTKFASGTWKKIKL
jgi:Na+-driven multidrug efflux pump